MRAKFAANAPRLGCLILATLMLLAGSWLFVANNPSNVPDVEEELVTLARKAAREASRLGILVDDGSIGRKEGESTFFDGLSHFENASLSRRYVFVLDYETETLVRYPRLRDREGKILSPFVGPGLVPFVVGVNDIATADEEGWVTYKWPEHAGAAARPKVSFIPTFGSWNWAFGSGYYLHEAHLAQREVLVFYAGLFGFAVGLLTFLASVFGLPPMLGVKRGDRGKNVAARLSTLAMRHAKEAMLVTDCEGVVIRANNAASSIWSNPSDNFVGTPLASLFASDAETARAIGQLLEVGQAAPGCRRFWSTPHIQTNDASGNRSVAVSASIFSLRAKRYFSISMRDVTDEREQARLLEWQATRDPLTGLPNRAMMRDLVDNRFEHVRRQTGGLVLYWLRYDRLRLLIDTVGAEGFDRICLITADRLRKTLRAADTVGRVGTDEFAVLTAVAQSPTQAGYTAERLIDAFAIPIETDDGSYQIPVSIGIAWMDGTARSSEELWQRAIAAERTRCGEAGSGYGFYRKDITEQARGRIRLEHDLRHAIDADELSVHYQPKVSTKDLGLKGFEALVRWNHPDRGAVSPGEFVPLAEETGLIVALGRWVLGTACRDLSEWLDAGLAPVPVAVNVSARQLMAGAASDFLETIHRTGVPTDLIEIEVTETAMMENIDRVMEELKTLHDAGVKVAIDDFGTGYSSLNYLRRLPVSTLKIDRSFVKELTANKHDRDIARLIVSMGHALGLDIVAEGVETPAQAELLEEFGAQIMQGFLFSPPVPFAKALIILQTPRLALLSAETTDAVVA